MTARLSTQRARRVQRLAASFQMNRLTPLKTFQKALGYMASASAVLQLGLLRMRPLQLWLKSRVSHRAWTTGRQLIKVTQTCIIALQPWTVTEWFQRGVSMGTFSRRKVISTDASNTGWGAVCEGSPAFGPWSAQESLLHINCLEMLADENALTRFLPRVHSHHVLIRSDNMAVVSYLNRQGGVRSRNLFRLTERILVWSQCHLLSLRATHVPGHLNDGPDSLSRNPIPPGEWSLHTLTVQKLWRIFGRAEVDLFASEENTHCPIFFSKSDDALAQTWPSRALYAFPPVSLLPQVLQRIRETSHSVLLIAPRWEGQTWFPELTQLSQTAPWPIPVRADLLSQARGTIWHPHPERWALHAWVINNYPLRCQKEC